MTRYDPAVITVDLEERHSKESRWPAHHGDLLGGSACASNRPASTSVASVKSADLNTNDGNAALMPLSLTTDLGEFLLHRPARAWN